MKNSLKTRSLTEPALSEVVGFGMTMHGACPERSRRVAALAWLMDYPGSTQIVYEVPQPVRAIKLTIAPLIRIIRACQPILMLNNQ